MSGKEIFLEADRQSNLGNKKKAFALLLERKHRDFCPLKTVSDTSSTMD